MKTVLRSLLFLAALGFAVPLSLPASDATVAQGAWVKISVTYDGGTPPVSFQWSKDGAPIQGATAQTLTLFPITPASAGVYTVDVTNAAGTAHSDNATVVVIVVASNVQTHSTQGTGTPPP